MHRKFSAVPSGGGAFQWLFTVELYSFVFEPHRDPGARVEAALDLDHVSLGHAPLQDAAAGHHLEQGPSPLVLAHRASRCDTKETSASVATATPELAQGTTVCIFRSGEASRGRLAPAEAKREQLGVGVGAEGCSGDIAF